MGLVIVRIVSIEPDRCTDVLIGNSPLAAWFWWMVLVFSSACFSWPAAWLLLLSPTIISNRMQIERGEFYILLLFSIGGMMMMAWAADLIIVFLALEWLSIPLYVLAGFAASPPGFGGGGPEIFPPGCLCRRVCGLWHRLDLWRGTKPPPWRALCRPCRRRLPTWFCCWLAEP